MSERTVELAVSTISESVYLGPSDFGNKHVDLAYGQEIDERFLVHVPIGEGGQARVYLCTDEYSGEQVALKVPIVRSEGGLDRVIREAEVSLALSRVSAGVPKTVGVGTSNDLDKPFVYIASEYMEGGSLHDKLGKEGKLAVDGLVKVFRPSLSAISMAHQAGIIHRDIKPGNFVLDNKGNGKICDFGLVATDGINEELFEKYDIPSGTMTESLTQGERLGTVVYSPHEVLVKMESYTKAGDVFSAGISMFMTLTGVHPYRRANTVEGYIEEISTREPMRVNELAEVTSANRHIVDVVECALERRPQDRPTMSELVAAL